jgi:hypothetical protein
MEKHAPKITSPIKPLERSTMTREENEEMHNQLSKLENQVNELRDKSIKKES